MSSPVEEFWNQVKVAEREVEVDIAKQMRQPTDGSVYIASLKDRRAPQVREGVVSLASKRLAAQKLVEGKHRLASDEEIAAYVSDMIERQRIARSSAAGAMGQIVLSGPKED